LQASDGAAVTWQSAVTLGLALPARIASAVNRAAVDTGAGYGLSAGGQVTVKHITPLEVA